MWLDGDRECTVNRYDKYDRDGSINRPSIEKQIVDKKRLEIAVEGQRSNRQIVKAVSSSKVGLPGNGRVFDLVLPHTSRSSLQVSQKNLCVNYRSVYQLKVSKQAKGR